MSNSSSKNPKLKRLNSPCLFKEGPAIVTVDKDKNNFPTKITIELKQYPTHVITYLPKTPKGKKKFLKINGQYFYNSKIKEHMRSKAMSELHIYYTQALNSYPSLKYELRDMLPIKIKMDWYTVPNHETVKVLKENLNFPAIIQDDSLCFEPSFDVDNQWPFIKSFQDTLVKDLGYLPEDTVKYLPASGSIQFNPISDFSERKLVFTIVPLEEKYKSDWERYFKYWRTTK